MCPSSSVAICSQRERYFRMVGSNVGKEAVGYWLGPYRESSIGGAEGEETGGGG